MNNLRSISHYILPLLIFAFFTSQAQEQTMETNSLKPGAWALQFGITNLLTLTSFQGATISAKYQSSVTNAWRAGVSIYGNTQTATSKQIPIQEDTLTTSNSLNKSSANETMTLKVQYIYYANSEGIIHFYSGAGPVVGYGHSATDQQDISRYGSFSTSRSTNQITNVSSNTWSAGASAVVGVEYFPTKVFSLHAEYGNYLTYQSTKSESTTRSTNNYGALNSLGTDGSGTTHGWILDNGSVYFGLSVYF